MAPDGSVAQRLRMRHLAVVFVGGMAGTAGRWAVGLAVEPSQTATLLVNLVGAFLLGVLVGALAERRDDSRNRTLRLLLGTGALGAWTSYSALVIEAWQVYGNAWMVGYLAAMLIGGLMSGWLGAMTGLKIGDAGGARWPH